MRGRSHFSPKLIHAISKKGLPCAITQSWFTYHTDISDGLPFIRPTLPAHIRIQSNISWHQVYYL